MTLAAQTRRGGGNLVITRRIQISQISPAEPAPSPVPVYASTPSKSQAPAGSISEPAFDPFVFYLVSVFKRKGAEGLRAKLDEIIVVSDLRAMAKAQHILLPKEIR